MLLSTMIVSYLAKIILLLPEITAADADKLANIAEQSQKILQKYPSTKRPIVADDVYSPMYDFNRPIKTEKNNINQRRKYNHRDDGLPSDCIPVNETMRKHLIKVSSFFSISLKVQNNF